MMNHLSRSIAISLSSKLKTGNHYCLFVIPRCSHFTTLTDVAETTQVDTNDVESMDSLAKDLFERPNQWVDYRKYKINGLVKPTEPDFKHKYNGHAIWIDRLPKWVELKLFNLENLPPKDRRSKRRKIIESLWKELLEKPSEWVDFRISKLEGSVNPKFPDFKQSGSNQGLWLNEAPKKILLELERLETSKRRILVENLWKELLKNPNKWMDFRSRKLNGSLNPKYPDFKQKDSNQELWLNEASKEILLKLEGLEFNQSKVLTRKQWERNESLWKDLIENPNLWYDNRNCKVNPKGPDFKYKNGGQSIWLSTAPNWALLKLDLLEFHPTKCVTANKKKLKEVLWEDLVDKPSQWRDNRKIKPRRDYPDFKKDSGESLWLNNTAPKWVLSKLDQLEFHPPIESMVKEWEFAQSLWKDLVEKPDQWLDHRKNKISSKYPDFEHKNVGIGLWLGEAPKWVLSKLNKLEDTLVKAREIEESLWTDLFTKPSQWKDLRQDKRTGLRNSKHPDFSHVVSSEGLWLNTAPKWVLNKLGLH